jgi:hypothetical protein
MNRKTVRRRDGEIKKVTDGWDWSMIRDGETRKVTDDRMTDNSEKQLIGQIAGWMDGIGR